MRVILLILLLLLIMLNQGDVIEYGVEPVSKTIEIEHVKSNGIESIIKNCNGSFNQDCLSKIFIYLSNDINYIPQVCAIGTQREIVSLSKYIKDSESNTSNEVINNYIEGNIGKVLCLKGFVSLSESAFNIWSGKITSWNIDKSNRIPWMSYSVSFLSTSILSKGERIDFCGIVIDYEIIHTLGMHRLQPIILKV